MTFSTRLQADLARNRLAASLDRARADGRRVVDLTLSNPTTAGFEYPDDLLTPLGDRRGLTYAPEPLGLAAARQAVSADYARRGAAVAPDRIALTTSTSEAYSLLFKILCDEGDEVLVPRPSYPLFEHLTRLDQVVSRQYDLEYHGSWGIDVQSVLSGMSARTRAVLLVSPNNPTGSFVRRDEFEEIANVCAERDVAIVADEVFADYALTDEAFAAAARVLSRDGGLVFSLGGLSKSVGLPQVKVGWIAVAGGDALVREAIARLELACDSYLSVSTPAQLALPGLLTGGAKVRAQIQARVTANHGRLSARVAAAPSCHLLRAEGGWSAVVQVPTFDTEEELVVDLLERDGVLVHPGYFFDFARESFLVISLLVEDRLFAEGLEKLFRRFDRAVAEQPTAVGRKTLEPGSPGARSRRNASDD